MIGRRKGSSTLTQLELQLMQVLWELGTSTVSEVQERLRAQAELAYTTVQTVLNTLERKGRVRRKLEGRAFSYEAVTSKESVLKQAIRDLAERMFAGSSEDLVMSLVKSRQVDAGRIADLSRRLAAEDEAEARVGRKGLAELKTIAKTKAKTTRKSHAGIEVRGKVKKEASDA